MQTRIRELVVAPALLVLATSGWVSVASAQSQTATARARVHRASPGLFLAAKRGNVTRNEMLGDFLRGRGASDATARSLHRESRHRSPSTGNMHVQMEQEVEGLRVHGSYVKAVFDRRGDLVHVIENVVPVPASVSRRTQIDEAGALEVVLRAFHPEVRGRLRMTERNGDTVIFAAHPAFHDQPRVERVMVPAADGGSLVPGFVVETWTDAGNLLLETTVDGEGRMLEVETRTSQDSYNVFADNPGTSAQTVVAGPGTGNAESPVGWLSSRAQTSVDIAGNNVNAYLDTDANDLPDGGGMPVSDGNFVSVADFDLLPAAPTNQAVAVQNVFYLSNVIHDTLYRHGFTETAGNFQDDNFRRGGNGRDAVYAEIQDGGGENNAVFTTPSDGRHPRLQMYLFQNDLVVVNAPAELVGTSFYAVGAEFGAPLTAIGFTGDVALSDDGVGTTTDACEPVGAGVAGRIALIDRGNCDFVLKVRNAQDAGAIAAIVANVDDLSLVRMIGEDPAITIPSAFVIHSDGQTLRSVAGVNVTIRSQHPTVRDSGHDSDLVWHEYGHGLTWRMIGGMSGPLARAVGEGTGDILAMIANEDDAFCEYLTGTPNGLRRARYTDYPRTYGDVTGAEEHDDGEVYGAIGWRLFEIFRREGLPKTLLLDYLVDGMNYTPKRPSFEDMRDGILTAVANAETGHECLIWEGFSAYGVGAGASGQAKGKNAVVITESFAVPAECNP